MPWENLNCLCVCVIHDDDDDDGGVDSTMSLNPINLPHFLNLYTCELAKSNAW